MREKKEKVDRGRDQNQDSRRQALQTFDAEAERWGELGWPPMGSDGLDGPVGILISLGDGETDGGPG